MFLLLLLVAVHISLQFSYCMVHLINFCGVTYNILHKKKKLLMKFKEKVKSAYKWLIRLERILFSVAWSD